LPRDDEGLLIVNPDNRRCLVYLFDLKAVNLSIDWKTKCLFASSKNECQSALTAFHNPNSNGGVFIGYESSADAILWSLNYECA
jgi:hypothetical protein